MESCDWLTNWSSAHSFLIKKHSGLSVLGSCFRSDVGALFEPPARRSFATRHHCFSAHNFHTVICTLFCTCIYCFCQVRKRLRASLALRGCVAYYYGHLVGALCLCQVISGVGFPHPLRLYIGAFRPSNYCSLERS
jgi:hypothetical protein